MLAFVLHIYRQMVFLAIRYHVFYQIFREIFWEIWQIFLGLSIFINYSSETTVLMTSLNNPANLGQREKIFSETRNVILHTYKKRSSLKSRRANGGVQLGDRLSQWYAKTMRFLLQKQSARINTINNILRLLSRSAYLNLCTKNLLSE